jgi:hypothetical protein
MLLAQGKEWIQFSGIVRLADVDAANQILSAQVADARIEYAGDGWWRKARAKAGCRNSSASSARSKDAHAYPLLPRRPCGPCLHHDGARGSCRTRARHRHLSGVRSNQLTGYGIVVGLDGTGDDTLDYTTQAMKGVSGRMGLQLPTGINRG